MEIRQSPILPGRRIVDLAAYAEAACSYSLSSLGIGGDGTVSASITGNGSTRFWVLCSAPNSWDSMSNGSSTFTLTADACKAMYSQLLTARASGVPSPYPYVFKD